jgi:hypothetical protein
VERLSLKSTDALRDRWSEKQIQRIADCERLFDTRLRNFPERNHCELMEEVVDMYCYKVWSESELFAQPLDNPATR